MDNEKIKRITKKIKVFGIVQGVGFRPLVYRMAKSADMNGTVRNVGGYVEIILQSYNETIDSFLSELQATNSSGCEIVKIEVENLETAEHYDDFTILGSGEAEEVSVIPPDLPVCPNCLEELYEESDRRFGNPFISCMSCGPRYTIIDELPYDRENTTMQDFLMCPSCSVEYTSPKDRRFHAQTISCNDCGPYIIYHEKSKELIDREALEKAVLVIKQGGILAVKGIGGYHLVCSPWLEETVHRLRALKGREEKPFAVMFESVEQIKEYCVVSDEERTLLETKARPIVLLSMHSNPMAPSINQGSITCGAFLPYTPLQMLLIRQCGPLIMTSANLSGKPIIREEEEILSFESPYLTGVLYNKRRILRSVDDSVAKILDGKPQLIRRSRGYVPYPVFMSEKLPRYDIFAAGGDLKAAFCLYQNGKAVVSQYFGDLEELSVMEEYKKSVHDLMRLLKIKPSYAVCDLHPNYFSSEYARTLGIPVLKVQHHHAHIASVMAEHDIEDKVIGVAFDGTGFGTDGNVWGGEFLICEGASFFRGGHLKYTTMLGGDESMKDARKTASCFLWDNGLEDEITDERKAIIKAALDHNINTVLTSSMGRLFDAVASILAISHKNRYEGECAICLEREAVFAQKNNTIPEELSFAISEINGIIELDPKPLLQTICRRIGIASTESLALGFHYAVADAISEICNRLRILHHSNVVALSGGVFQNTVLTEHVLKLLQKNDFKVYMNHSVPPNDGAISLGQTYIALHSNSDSE